jgi:hypothetical protein
MKRINEKHILPNREDLPASLHEGLMRVCERRNYAFMLSLDIALALLKDMPCVLTPVLGASIPDTLSLVMAKGSPYTEIVNYK